MDGRYESDGAKLAYSDTGSGMPVFFLHPTPLNRGFWRPLIVELGGVRAIAPDLRGHGQSELGESLKAGGFALVPNAPVLTMAQIAADVFALADHLRIAEAVYVGCSIGGYVLLEMWRQQPERMRGLGFVCSKPQPDSDAGREKRAANIASVREKGVEPIFDGMAQSLVGTTARGRRPELVTEVRKQMTLSADAVVATQAGLGTRPDSLPTVATIDAPLLAIAGGEDVAVSAAEMEALRAAPGGCCEYHLVPDGGHFAAYEQPEKVARLLAEWLKQFGL